MYEHILVALDGSQLAEKVLPYVQELAEKFGSTVTLLRATAPLASYIEPAAAGMPMMQPLTPVEDYEQIIDANRSDAGEYLKALAERLTNAGIKVDTDEPEGRPAEAILERASALSASLIAMTTHGYGGLERVVMGSVADEVVRKSECPVLLIRAIRPK